MYLECEIKILMSRMRKEKVEVEEHIFIISTPEELLPLITEAHHAAISARYTNSDGVGQQNKNTVRFQRWEKKGIHMKTLAYWCREGIGPAYTNFGRCVF